VKDCGELILDGYHFRNDIKEYRSRLAYVLQACPYSVNMCAAEVGERYGYYYPGFDQSKYEDLLKRYEIPRIKAVIALSKGQVIRLQLAFALSYPAKLYVFDEPAGNLDVEFRDEFYREVRSLTENEECSVIISSHLVTELEEIADELLWIGREEDRGFIRFYGNTDELRERYRMLSVDSREDTVIPKNLIIGKKIRETHSEYLLDCMDKKTENMIPIEMQGMLRYASLQEIMYYTEKKEEE
jgi:ABC-2 type transport system ATP-binding protein